MRIDPSNCRADRAIGGCGDDDLRQALAAIVPSGSPGAMVRIEVGGSVVMESAVGEVAFGSGRLLTPAHPFRLAATTRPITAATVLRLQERGHLSIDDPISRYLNAALVAALHVVDGVSRGGEITIRHLLGQTSGLADRRLDTQFLEEVLTEPARTWDRSELVEYLIEHTDPWFAPGFGFLPSDGGDVVLAMIIEAVTEQPLHLVYRQQVLDPLGMSATYQEGSEIQRGLELSHPYLADFDAAAVHPSAEWGGGALVSTVADLVRFGAGLVDGELFEHPETAADMVYDPGTGYGLGLYVSTTGDGLTILGHDGCWGSVLLMIPELDLVMAATMNQFVDNEIREKFFTGLIDLVSPG